ncbi:hypothetical protein AAVH_31242, partial [Aphelenchoides avenae]
MIPELRHELLFFYTRDELERLQPLSQTLLDMIVAGSNVLPLRPICCVDMDYHDVEIHSIDMIKIYVEEPTDVDGSVPDYEASIHHGDFAETFSRLRNTCVKEFNVGIRDSPFLRYWRAQEAAVFTMLSIEFRLTNDTDYDILDSIVNCVRPRSKQVLVEESSWHENGYNNEELQLLTRESFLKNLQSCHLAIWEGAFPPPSFILDEPGYPNYELWCKNSNVAAGIDGFIESFVRDGCANKRLKSVCIQWFDGEGQQSPAPEQLKKPTKIDMPLPKIDLTAWLIHTVHQMSQCETNSFVNAKQWKQMDVYKWTIDYDNVYYGRITTDILQCL